MLFVQKPVSKITLKEFGDEEDSFRKLNANNLSINKTVLCKSEIELKSLDQNKKRNEFSEELTSEIIDVLDINSLKSILKSKIEFLKTLNGKILNFENSLKIHKEKIDELTTIMNLLQKEAHKNNSIIMQLKKENASFRKNIKNIDNSSIKLKKSSNYFLEKREDDKNEESNDSREENNLENQFLGDSDVSFSSNIDKNNASKKWFSGTEKLEINFDDLSIKFKKLQNLNKCKIACAKQYKFIEIEVCNISNSPLVMQDFQLDSSES